MNRIRVETAAGPMAGWRGGRGPHLMLIHGGWGDAEAHWAQVWDALAEDFDVLAIDMEGVWDRFGMAPASYSALAARCAAFLSANGIDRAILAGNSLGASVAWQVALDHPARVASLVMINGFAPRPLPLRALLGLWPFSALALRTLTRAFYSRQVLSTGFMPATRVPAAIKRNLTAQGPDMARAMFRLLLSVTAPSANPAVPVDFVWGQADTLPGVRLADGLALQAACPGARLFEVPDARHLPQVDNPDAFLAIMRQVLADPDRVRPDPASGAAVPVSGQT